MDIPLRIFYNDTFFWNKPSYRNESNHYTDKLLSIKLPSADDNLRPFFAKYHQREWMGLTEQRQRAKNVTDYRQNGKKLPTTDRKNINRLPTWTDIIFFQREEHT